MATSNAEEPKPGYPFASSTAKGTDGDTRIERRHDHRIIFHRPGAAPLAPVEELGSHYPPLALVMLFGIPSVLGPLVMWILKKAEDPYVDFHGKEAINFNLSILIYAIVAGVLIFVAVGLLLLPAVLITWLVFVIIATVKAGAGEHYRYPLTIRFVS